MMEAIQKTLTRVRPPRVRLTYDVHTNGGIEKHELPFVVAMFADLTGEPADPAQVPGVFHQRQLIEIDRDNFNDVLNQSQPRAKLATVADVVAGAGATITTPLVFTSLEDFSPVNVIKNVGVLKQLSEQTAALRQLQGQAADDQAAATVQQRVTDMEDLLNKQLALVIGDATFKALEATWRGLFHVVERTETGAMLKLHLFNATVSELRTDLDKAVALDQSHLFKLVYQAEYGTFGGTPYSLLVGGYELAGTAQDINFMRHISSVAAAAHAPFIAAASPMLFGLDSFANLARPRDLAKIFEGEDLQAWQEFRASEDSRYLTLVLPRVLLRLPYDEQCDANGEYAADSDKLLWGNAAWFLAERITNAFSLYGWPAAISGVEGGGLVQGLPVYTRSVNRDGIAREELLCPVEAVITDHRAQELAGLGFIPLCYSKGSAKVFFSGSSTSYQPAKYISDDANANAKLSSYLPYILAASRFEHYVKIIVRDKVGSFLTRANIEQYLNSWIAQYVLLDDTAAPEVQASFPLRAAQIVVTEVPGSPGSYRATLFIKPHFQLQELTTSLRLVAELPA